eukprot:253179-Hanusia_phi.AAC.1
MCIRDREGRVDLNHVSVSETGVQCFRSESNSGWRLVVCLQTRRGRGDREEGGGRRKPYFSSRVAILDEASSALDLVSEKVRAKLRIESEEMWRGD